MFAWANSRVANGRREVPSLIQLSLAALAANSEMIDDLRCTDEQLCTTLLRLVMGAGRLDFRLACVFRDAGHESIRHAMEGLNLLDAMPTHNVNTPCRNPRR